MKECAGKQKAPVRKEQGEKWHRKQRELWGRGKDKDGNHKQSGWTEMWHLRERTVREEHMEKTQGLIWSAQVFAWQWQFLKGIKLTCGEHDPMWILDQPFWVTFSLLVGLPIPIFLSRFWEVKLDSTLGYWPQTKNLWEVWPKKKGTERLLGGWNHTMNVRDLF